MARLVSLTDEDILLIHTLIDNCPQFYTRTKTLHTKLVKSQNRIKHSSAKAKGRDFQYWLCKKISGLLGIPYNQQEDDCLIHSREMSQQGVDIVLRGMAREMFPFDIEAKSTKELNVHDAIEQAESNASGGRFGIVAYRQTNTKPFIAMSFSTFEALYKRFILPYWNRGGD